jgi:hypothetical protein
MTPKEIVDNIAFCTSRVLSESDTKLAIEAIKLYAKQMCDKQKLECTKVGYAMDAPYPNELI